MEPASFPYQAVGVEVVQLALAVAYQTLLGGGVLADQRVGGCGSNRFGRSCAGGDVAGLSPVLSAE